MNVDYKIYRAMRKYNTTKDDFEIIESNIDSQDLANEREIHWIAFYDSYHNGYNSTPGGQTGSYCLGEKSHFAKLSEEDVINIRRIRYTKKYQRSEIWELYKTQISESAFGILYVFLCCCVLMGYELGSRHRGDANPPPRRHEASTAVKA